MFFLVKPTHLRKKVKHIIFSQLKSVNEENSKIAVLMQLYQIKTLAIHLQKYW